MVGEVIYNMKYCIYQLLLCICMSIYIYIYIYIYTYTYLHIYTHIYSIQSDISWLNPLDTLILQ